MLKLRLRWIHAAFKQRNIAAPARAEKHAPHPGPVPRHDIADAPDPKMEHLAQLSIGGIGPQQPIASLPIHLCEPDGQPCGRRLDHIVGLTNERSCGCSQALIVCAKDGCLRSGLLDLTV